MATGAHRTASRPLLALLAHLAHVARREAELVGFPDGLRPRHLVALTLLRDHGAAAQAGLAESLRLDPSNVVGLLNDLEARGLVTRRRDPDDRRRHIVELAAPGRRALEEAERRLAAVEDTLLRALSPEDRATLHELLLRAAGDQIPTCADAAVDQLGC